MGHSAQLRSLQKNAFVGLAGISWDFVGFLRRFLGNPGGGLRSGSVIGLPLSIGHLQFVALSLKSYMVLFGVPMVPGCGIGERADVGGGVARSRVGRGFRGVGCERPLTSFRDVKGRLDSRTRRARLVALDLTVAGVVRLDYR